MNLYQKNEEIKSQGAKYELKMSNIEDTKTRTNPEEEPDLKLGPVQVKRTNRSIDQWTDRSVQDKGTNRSIGFQTDRSVQGIKGRADRSDRSIGYIKKEQIDRLSNRSIGEEFLCENLAAILVSA